MSRLDENKYWYHYILHRNYSISALQSKNPVCAFIRLASSPLYACLTNLMMISFDFFFLDLCISNPYLPRQNIGKRTFQNIVQCPLWLVWYLIAFGIRKLFLHAFDLQIFFPASWQFSVRLSTFTLTDIGHFWSLVVYPDDLITNAKQRARTRASRSLPRSIWMD